MLLYSPPRPLDAVPLIDLQGDRPDEDRDDDAIAAAIGSACRDIGFFYAANHGISADLVAAQFEWSRRFFGLPEAEKRALHMRNSPSKSGFEPILGQQLDSHDDSGEAAPPDLKEGYWWGRDLPDDHPQANAGQRNIGHNQVPSSLPGFREQMLAYQGAMAALGSRVAAAMARSLGLEDDWFAAAFADAPNTTRLLHYPPHPAESAYNQLGAGAHTDWGAITLLAQDDTGGLEVRNAALEWLSAPPVPGAFVVNLGDLMARWTNGVYASTMHRVKTASGGRDRYSVAFFYSPRHDAVIAPVPTCVGPEQPARFPPCTTTAHMDEMFRRSYGFAVTA